MVFRAMAVTALFAVLTAISLASLASVDGAPQQALSKTASIRQVGLHRCDWANVAEFAANGGFVRYNGFWGNNWAGGAEALINSDVYRNVRGSEAESQHQAVRMECDRCHWEQKAPLPSHRKAIWRVG